jgi:hypothetical protein
VSRFRSSQTDLPLGCTNFGFAALAADRAASHGAAPSRSSPLHERGYAHHRPSKTERTPLSARGA